MRRRQRRVVVQFSGNGPLAFSRLLGIVAEAVFVARKHDAGPRFPEVRGKSKTVERYPFFGNKTAGHRTPKPGYGRRVSVLPRTFGSAFRKYAANSGTPVHAGLFE